MTKKSILLLFLLLSLNGCVERGQTVTPYASMSHRSHQSEANTTIVQPAYVLRLNANDRKIDTVQNSVSGTLMLVIGLIIFL